MSVVNCRVKYIRPQYQNLKEWMEDNDNIYIGRAGVVFIDIDGKPERFPKLSSPFCNPYRIGVDGTREDVIAKYRCYIVDKLKGNPDLVELLLSMQGKNLGCWCHPDACHGDVLIKLIKLYSRKK
jgi:hypothetical protein